MNDFVIENTDLGMKLTKDNIGKYLVLAEELYRGFFDEYEFDGEVYTPNDQLFTDEEFDRLKEKYQEEFDAAYHEIASVSNRIFYKHPIPCGTLQKYTAKNITQLQNKFKKSGDSEFIITHKYDGTSCRIYINYSEETNEFYITALSRGDSKNTSRGLDITNKIQDQISGYIDQIKRYMLLHKLDLVVLRGELIFKKKNTSEDYNLRALVSGQSTSQNKMTCDLVLYEFLMKKDDDFIETTYQFQLDMLNALTGQELPYAVLSLDELNEPTFQKFKKQRPIHYMSDGIVIKANNIYERQVGEKPKNQVAFKFESQIYESTIKGYQWKPRNFVAYNNDTTTNNLGMDLRLECVIEIEPVKMPGKTVKQCKGFTPQWLIVNNLLPGEKILIVNSGEVVPNCKYTYEPSTAKDLFENGLKSGKYQQKQLTQILPKKCFCGGKVRISKDGDFECVSRNCEFYNYIAKTKDALGLTGFGKKTIQDTFDKIVKSNPKIQFQKWFIEQAKDKEITEKELAKVFLKQYGEKKAEKEFKENRTQLKSDIIQRLKNIQYTIIGKKFYPKVAW